MCGITGWIEWNGVNQQEHHHVLKEMTNQLVKRGTDDEGYYFNQHVAFGHRRLAVIDVENGRQPMVVNHVGHTYTIIYNGELYNTEALRKELMRQGFRFRTTCDTEVLLNAYVHWGSDCLHYLNGIYAFAIWDDQQESIFIARDRLGVKPLFYAEVDKKVIFGSEIKAILKHPDVEPVVERDGLAEVFGLGPSRTPGHGIFAQIQELRAGHAMIVSPKGLKKWRYWNVKSEEHTDSFDETVEKVKALFIDAVERQLVSDVPLSTFLSGGVDSSAITAIAANHFKINGKGQLPTFSIDYKGNDQYFEKSDYQPTTDSDFIKVMSKQFDTDHSDCVINEEDLFELLKESVILRDQPGMADVDSSLLWFCRKIKEKTTVSLSGECADEIFGGYPWFHNPESNGDNGFPWIRSLDYREDLLLPDWKKKLNLKDYVYHRYQETIEETPLLDGESEIDQKRRQMFYLNMHWFMTQLLDRKDRMSMGATLEVRVPFADHKLVEYVWNVPWEMKNVGGHEKGLLRKALEGTLPNEILYRKKNPYPKTFQPQYTKLVMNWMNDILQDPNSRLFELLAKDKVKQLVDSEGGIFKEPWYGQLMKGPQLIAHLCQIDYWMRQYDIKIK
ncbi:asparagine synthase (glutamine-hydrolyzing) [Tenuibacillus multivorans]|uniref:asparagine synthase (glutamine-hydrolyzing) n=1 Tax=Tenuibacillus multivorans TaxID=237069 RepID=A0A1H0B3T8_9BACI|nr:asparagine synthase (glutamine-hydrolyzing) [Tenuibacillus multivorans]GEL77542.1 asparagine synthetase [glutamine-hydrolyzing] 3 [Tenuibacillus multivorans]SDN40277.1 asparagine synthase (glutamine-hydrolysing) [Tenuibacillus multivorans]